MADASRLERHRHTPKRFYFITALIYLPILYAMVVIHARWFSFVLAVFSFVMLLWMRHKPLWRGLRIVLCFAMAFLVAFFGLYWGRPQQEVSLMGQIGRESVRFFLSLPLDRETRLGKNLENERDWDVPEGYAWNTVRLTHCSMETLAPQGSTSPHAVLQLHGGAFEAGMNDLYRVFAKRYCDMAGGALVATVNYRLWPPNDYPTQQEDAMDAWRYLTRALHYAPENILVVGDSAGGNLALSLCLRLRDQGEPLPGALIAMSPWADLSNAGPSHIANATHDPTFGVPADGYDGSPVGVPSAYGSKVDLQDPYISPSFGDYRGFPPMLLQASSNEVLLSDSQLVQQNALNSGVDCNLTVYQDMFHVFQGSLDLVPESVAAWAEIGAFIQRHTGVAPLEAR